ncbi:Bug family tripartite tricarboxylate transporter substrate binding protein [Caenimonas aquaedulcis]|uniref:Tripartite tricarboxylate transporter substrate binding protein n=1 Tax=Caenimonas aquaedulcis TaxID=2793270 RepID=A0A931H3V8_9BURK|nr:tripartite tricarboxylate transporter substrate binding protein [Caenimonas aquaedulcis]MBG9388076.1 tripartite tricarboxylate transporter substrate binding protein [Caenimonas aquaedulcis]
MRTIHAFGRRAVLALAAAAFGTFAAAPAMAQAYPNRPIKLIVPWPAGGVTDASARLLAQHLGDRLKQNVVVDNRAGANGRIGAELAAKSPPDGYTFFLASAETHAINPTVFASVPYDPIKDFVAIAPYAINPFTVTARADIKASNMKEAVALAKASPGKLTSASWGIGSTSQIILEMIKGQAGIDVLHVPFQGEAPAVTALLGSQVDLMVMPAARADQLSRDGKVKVLAVTTGSRFALLKDVPTLSEQGYKIDVANWFGVVAPAKTPPEVVQKVNEEINALLRGNEFPEALRKLGVDAHPAMTAPQYQKFIETEGTRWGTVIKAARIRLE